MIKNVPHYEHVFPDIGQSHLTSNAMRSLACGQKNVICISPHLLKRMKNSQSTYEVPSI